MAKFSRFLLAALLLVSSSALAAPTAEQAEALVKGIANWSLTGPASGKVPVEWQTVKSHPDQFSPELFGLMEWVETPRTDAEGKDWQYAQDALWQVQSSGIISVKVGKAKPEGDYQLVAVDYVSPSPISPSRPSTRFHNIWVVAQEGGNAVVRDIRYHIKAPAGTYDGTLLADLKKAKSNFKAP